MIICFSGTGNTRAAADYLSERLGDEVLRLPPGLMREPEKVRLRVADGRLIWMFPVHGWDMPYTVDKTIRSMTILGHADIIHHLVCTCGDDIGYADREWRTEIQSRGWRAGSAYSLQMPNIYVALPGFDVDAPEVAKEKLDKMPARLDQIADSILAGQTTAKDVKRGSFAFLKTYVIGWYFRHFLTGTHRFHTTDKCKGCGKCARNCPLGCIVLADGKPKWEGQCTMCLRCYHLCPHNAVQYGKHTQGKGQYLHPKYILK